MTAVHEMMSPVVLEFDNRLAEHLAAERLYYRSTFWFKVDKVVAIHLLIFGVFAVVVAGIRWWTVVWFPLAILEWFNLLSFRPLLIRFFFKRNPKFLEKYHLTFSDSGIDFKTKSLESKLAWTHYTHVLEGERVTLLIYGPQMYTVIPSRAFLDGEQHDRFRLLVRKYVLGSAGADCTKKKKTARNFIIAGLVSLLVALAVYVGIVMWIMSVSGFDECFMCHDVPGDPCYEKGHPCL